MYTDIYINIDKEQSVALRLISEQNIEQNKTFYELGIVSVSKDKKSPFWKAIRGNLLFTLNRL